MSNLPIKILFFSDTHLGYDLTLHPRVQRRRRGEDFFSNYQYVLDTALTEKVQLVIHGGDVFFRSKVPAAVINKAFDPLLEIAAAGIPVYLVPGNHERSRLPGHLWSAHENIQIFDKPKTYRQMEGNLTIALSGFPFARQVKHHFTDLLWQTDYHQFKPDIHFLCLHQTFEGAQVGPKNFTFGISADNIPGSEIPPQFDAVLSGHIHRSQQLTHTLDREPLPAPVIYSGSIERTSFAERFEEKHYVIIKIFPGPQKPNQVIEYHQLPTRPMKRIVLLTHEIKKGDLKSVIQKRLADLNPECVVQIQVGGLDAESYYQTLSAAYLRSIAPSTMNISLANQRHQTQRKNRTQLHIPNRLQT